MAGGIERPDTDREATMLLDLEYGALATSGDRVAIC